MYQNVLDTCNRVRSMYFIEFPNFQACTNSRIIASSPIYLQPRDLVGLRGHDDGERAGARARPSSDDLAELDVADAADVHAALAHHDLVAAVAHVGGAIRRSFPCRVAICSRLGFADISSVSY